LTQSSAALVDAQGKFADLSEPQGHHNEATGDFTEAAASLKTAQQHIQQGDYAKAEEHAQNATASFASANRRAGQALRTLNAMHAKRNDMINRGRTMAANQQRIVEHRGTSSGSFGVATVTYEQWNDPDYVVVYDDSAFDTMLAEEIIINEAINEIDTPTVVYEDNSVSYDVDDSTTVYGGDNSSNAVYDNDDDDDDDQSDFDRGNDNFDSNDGNNGYQSDFDRGNDDNSDSYGGGDSGGGGDFGGGDSGGGDSGGDY